MTHSIKINGKEVLVKFGMHLQESLFASFKAGDLLGTLKFATVIIYYGHENWALGADLPVVVTKGEVFNWLEDAYSPEGSQEAAQALNGLLAAYADSSVAQRIKDAGDKAQEASESAKKKLVGEMSEVLQPELLESAIGNTTNSLSSSITNY